MRPSDAEYNFWSPIVSCANHGAMVFVVKGRAPEVYQIDLWAKQHSPELCRTLRQCAGGGNIPIVGKSLIGVVQQQNILWLQVRVD